MGVSPLVGRLESWLLDVQPVLPICAPVLTLSLSIEGAPAMKRPQDEVTLSPEEGAALIERLERNTLSADDRRQLVQVVRWLFWLLFVVQEAKLSLKRLRALVFGKPSPPPQEESSEVFAVLGRRSGDKG